VISPEDWVRGGSVFQMVAPTTWVFPYRSRRDRVRRRSVFSFEVVVVSRRFVLVLFNPSAVSVDPFQPRSDLF